ncbi:MAG: hypothetical protein QNJ97_20810 [Myxococcota bacterium]|nr:hypothetical protein [Myxococcota bacterium]
MLSPQERLSKLEDLLNRVRQNRERIAKGTVLEPAPQVEPAVASDSDTEVSDIVDPTPEPLLNLSEEGMDVAPSEMLTSGDSEISEIEAAFFEEPDEIQSEIEELSDVEIEELDEIDIIVDDSDEVAFDQGLDGNIESSAADIEAAFFDEPLLPSSPPAAPTETAGEPIAPSAPMVSEAVAESTVEATDDKVLAELAEEPVDSKITDRPPPGLPEETLAPEEAVSDAALTPPVMPAIPQAGTEPAEEEVRAFETTPTASGDVAAIQNPPQRDWTLAAVLERAWQLGAKEE